MTVVLDKDVESLVQQQTVSAGCPSADVLVNDLLRAMCSQQHAPGEWSPETEAWLLEASDSPVTPLSAGDFNAIREKTRVRLAAATA